MKDEQSYRTEVESRNIMLDTWKDLNYINQHSELAFHPSSFIFHPFI